MFHICGEQNLNLPMIRELYLGTRHIPFMLSFGHEVDLTGRARCSQTTSYVETWSPRSSRMARPSRCMKSTRRAIEKGQEGPERFHLDARMRSSAHGAGLQCLDHEKGGERFRVL